MSGLVRNRSSAGDEHVVLDKTLAWHVSHADHI